MDKLKMHSPDLTATNIDKIAELFPNVITETIEGEGDAQVVKLAVDFDLLRQELSDHVIEGAQERYQLDWPGKRAAEFAANAPIAKTLRPVREESLNFDTTKNLFIEGDNLDALKLLQESYLGKIKLIYIDPPYNTGNDFVYDDDFAQTTDDYLARSGQVDESGTRLVVNTESKGRFHSDWLTMLYPRLKLSRNLLTPDGLICISIDDNEYPNMRALCDRVFGGDSCLGVLVWRRRQTPDSRNRSRVSTDHEYVVIYGRSDAAALRGTGIDATKYQNPDNDPRGPWTSENLTGLANAMDRPNLHFDIVDPTTGRVFPPHPSRGWAKNRESVARLIAENRILFPRKPDGRPREKKFLNDLRSELTGFSTWLSSELTGYNYTATRQLTQLMGGKYFDFPKPVELLRTICEQATAPGDVVLDYFAGSGTTAQSLLELNAADGGNRRFLLVQLPEPFDGQSEAAQAGFETIAELARERIRRAGERIFKGPFSDDWDGDTGYRLLTVDSTNLSDVLRTPDEAGQGQLVGLVDSVKPDRTGEDLLFQLLLDWGLDLSLPMTVEEVEGHEVFVVDHDALFACFDGTVSLDLVRAVANREPLRAVFRDSGFASDDARINAEQIFREVSPSTDVKTI